MKRERLTIAESEYHLLKDYLEKVGAKDAVHMACYNKLKSELAVAEVITDAEMPTDVVRLNSVVDMETPFGSFAGYQVVMPKDAKPNKKKLSILTPMGSALIGYATGDEVLWHFPGGEKTITIKNVDQVSTGAEQAG